MKFTKITLWHLKTPKKPIGLVDVFSPRPAGAQPLPKITHFGENGAILGEISIKSPK